MTDRLAEIKARMKAHADTSELRQRYFRIYGAIDLGWLVGEVERLREEGVELRRGFQRRNFELHQELKWLRDLLGRLEWAGGPHGGDRWCPACKEYEDQGHADCELAEALQRRDPPEESPPPEGR